MTDEHFQRVEKLFLAAHELAPDQRAGFLDRACADDASLRAEVEGLLAQDADPHELIRTLAFGKGVQRAAEQALDAAAATKHDRSASPERSPDDPLLDQVGQYRIIRVLGQGGMGTVYEAEQEKPRRTVALKVIRPGVVTQELLRRFEHEAQVLGRLQHPGIAQIYEAGTHETTPSRDREGADLDLAGRVPYFAMEYIANAKPITDYAKERNLGPRARLQLLAEVCDAVQHAHQKGVIHRDLKPGNILVSEAGQPKILDFGVARATDSDIQMTTMQTDIGQLIGTIPYMSPEQAAGDPNELDTRSDVYALGVIAYELLADRLPYDIRQRMIHEAVRVIREDDPTPLSSVNRVFRGDVETIVAKALAKEKDRRYQSASDLASDVRHYLCDEPIAARPASAMYQFRKFARRNKALVGGIVAVFVVLVAGIIATSTALSREAEQRRLAEDAQRQQSREREGAEAARDEAEAVTTFLTDTLAAVDPEKQGKDVPLREVLDKASKTIGERFADKPLIEARLRSMIGWTYRGLGLYDNAEAHLVDAAALYRSEKGPRHPDTVTALSALGIVLGDRGNYTAAEARLKAVLEVQRRVLGEQHSKTLTSMNNLAVALGSQGKYAEAEALHRSHLEIERRVLGDDHPHTLASMGNLANALQAQGKYAEAEEMHRKTLEIRRRVMREEHPKTLTSMTNLANAVYSQGQYANAEELYRKTLDIQRRVLGEAHMYTLASMNSLAATLDDQGKYAEAEEMHRKTLAIQRRVLGGEHPDTFGSISNLAAALYDQGKYAEAEGMQRKTLEIQRGVLGEEHPDTLMAMIILANALYGQGKYAEAEALYRKTLEVQRRVLGEEHPRTLASMGNLAVALCGQGKYAEAEEMHRETLGIMRRVLGEDHPYTLSSMGGLLDSLNVQNKSDEARALAAELIECRRRRAENPQAVPMDLNAYAWLLVTCEPKDLRDSKTALPLAQKAVEETGENNYTMLQTLALAYQMTGDINKAVETQRKALTLPPPDPTPLRTQLEMTLGEYLVEQGSHADAEPVLLCGYEGLTESEYVKSDDRKEAIERLIKLYESWHAVESDAGYDAKAAEWRAKLAEE